MGGKISLFFHFDICLLLCFLSEFYRSEKGWFIPVAPSRAVHVHLLGRTMCVPALTQHVYTRYKGKVTKCCSIPLLGGQLWEPGKKMYFCNYYPICSRPYRTPQSLPANIVICLLKPRATHLTIQGVSRLWPSVIDLEIQAYQSLSGFSILKTSGT